MHQFLYFFSKKIGVLEQILSSEMLLMTNSTNFDKFDRSIKQLTGQIFVG